MVLVLLELACILLLGWFVAIQSRAVFIVTFPLTFVEFVLRLKQSFSIFFSKLQIASVDSPVGIDHLSRANKLIILKGAIDSCAILHNETALAMFLALDVFPLISEKLIVELILPHSMSQLALSVHLPLVFLHLWVVTSCWWPLLGMIRDCYLVSYIVRFIRFWNQISKIPISNTNLKPILNTTFRSFYAMRLLLVGLP